MKIADIDLLERIIARHKYRYEILDTCFNESVMNTIVYVPINLSVVLTELSQYGESLDDNTDFSLHCAIGIMNLIAHYKHYYTLKKVELVIIVAYVKDGYYYNLFKDIISLVENMCEFFPNIYFINNIASIKHTILVAGFIRYIHSVLTTEYKSCIHIYSSLNIDKQLLCLFPTKEAYKICKHMNSNTVDFLSKHQFISKIFKDNDEMYSLIRMYKSEIERLVVLLGLYFGSYECYSSSEKNNFNITFSREKLKNKVQNVLHFFNTIYDRENLNENINNQFEKYLSMHLISKNKMVESLANYTKRFDFFSHQGQYIHKIMQQVYNANKSKIKDYEIDKESEKYKLFINHQLYENWLL